MVVKLYEADGVKVFNVTADKVIPAWVSKKRGRNLSKDAEYARHIDLIQDFGFPSACHRIKITQEGHHIFTTGVHAPRVRVFDLHDLSLKFERHFTSEVVDFEILTEDYEKCVFLCMDRSLNFHSKGGQHFSTRVPKFGRDLVYLPHLAEVAIGGSASELWRVSLTEGRFMKPVPLAATAANTLGVSPVHGMLAAGCDDGILECFDMRQKHSLGALDAAAAIDSPGENITALRFDNSGMFVAVGTSGGRVGVFDLRRSKPMVVKDHMYDTPIVDIKFHVATGDHTGRQKVVSADNHIVKVWEKDTGVSYTSIEPPGGNVNDVCLWPSSGLMMMASDATKIPIFFCPSLGPAPRWCSFLESVVEDLEATGGNSAVTVYDDYRFVTKEELEKLQLAHLVGTPVLKAYMHGYFMDSKLYRKAMARSEPFAYEEYRSKRAAEKLEEERQSRIALVRKAPKVNAAAHVRLQATATQEKGEHRNAAKRGTDAKVAQAILDDKRFSAFFDDADFAVDEESDTFKLLNPNAANRKKSEEEQLVAEHFKRTTKSGAHQATTSRGSNMKLGPEPQGKEPEMFEARERTSADLFAMRASLKSVREVPLGQRDRDRPTVPSLHVQRARAAAASAAKARAAEELAYEALDKGWNEGIESGAQHGKRGRGRGGRSGRGRRGRGPSRGGMSGRGRR